jgi:diguanylate cyclase (GGDEF)-like protein/PAS domain S-box-containing protein
MESGEPDEMELGGKDHFGNMKYFSMRVVPEYNEHGKVVSLLTMANDITEHKRMQEAIVAREQEFRSLAESSPDLIIRVGSDLRFRYLNANMVKYLDLGSAEEVIGRRSIEVWTDGRFNEVDAARERVVATGEMLAFEAAVPTADGKIARHHVVTVPERDADGHIIGTLTFGHDITAIRETEQRLSSLVENLPGLAYTLLLSPQGELSFPYVSAGIEDIYGITPEAAMGDFTAIHGLLHPDDKAGLEAAVAESARTLTPFRVEVRICPPGQPEHWLDVRSDPQAQPDGSILWYGLMFDITGRKRMEDVLKEKFERIVALNNQLEINARDLEDHAVEYEAQAVELEASRDRIMQTEAWYRNIVRSAPDGMVVVNESGLISLVNMNIEKMLGYEEGEMIGLPVEILLPCDVRHGHGAKRDGFFASGAMGRPMDEIISALRACRKDGSEFPVYVSLSRLPDMDGRTGVICAAIRDVSEHKRLEDELAAREQESRTLVDNSPDTISRYNRDCRRIFVNQVFGSMVEGGTAALLGKTPTECPGGLNAGIYQTKINAVFETGENSEFELIWTNKDDREICSHERITAERDAAGNVVSVLTVGRDITELNEHRKRVYQMAFYDLITSLPNRALFSDRLHQMIADASWHGQIAGVMLLDLDRFKVVNDTLGHPAGDELLRETATRLMYCVRGYDTVARLGGDEFAILLPELRSGDDLGREADKILEAFKTPFLLEGKEIFVSGSIGIAIYPTDTEDADDLLKHADSAMYLAKRSGRNTFRFYSKDLTGIANERLLLEADLRHGFERGELELFYQPKVNLSNGSLIGSEALLRWNHPQRGLVPPDKFISIAEDCGLIVEIGKWVLREACRVACEWNSNGNPFHKVAINLSARQFQANDLVKTVQRALDDSNCETGWIELEITESLLLDEDGDVLPILEKFREMGITIAIDDFGTGYSSLSYLARYPITTLKIDRSFIIRVTEIGHQAELVKAIISIAHSLNQQVVAEGAETAEQVKILKDFGCHQVQGYFYGKPMPKRTFEDFASVMRQKLVEVIGN